MTSSQPPPEATSGSSSDTADSKKLQRTQIQSLFTRLGMESPSEISPLAGGMTNPAYLVDHRYVLRLNTLDSTTPKFEREAYALRSLRYTGVPVPQVMFCDSAGIELGCPSLCTALLPGNRLDDCWSSMTSCERISAARHFGEILATIHSQSMPAFGDPVDSAQQRESWTQYLHLALTVRLENAGRSGAVAPELLSRIEKLFADHAALLTYSGPAALLHGDFQPRNAHVQDGRIVGIFDFEWALGGDPEYDFRVADSCFEHMPGSWNSFREGYSSIRPFSVEFGRKVLLYQLLWRFGLLPRAQTVWGAEFYSLCLDRLNGCYEAINREQTGPFIPAGQ